ncbi:Uncharacterized membrane protein [Clostridium acidisoli DSM 12555]|uniref:Uncharacterized membrane protein n=1 Tax=Clostridium acidisoli DSM 12555 TaxID=1121291 RepID=A0A1W1XYL9_9CLOT|nr:ECF transporter S component [Clostridium acidisoli]SMC28608.1 Uncharacterized membrane protein [Clostridium acidisoli DSM 12555]
MEAKRTNTRITTISMVQVAFMAAIIYVATAMFNIPVGLGYKGVVHLGDSMVFVAAIILTKKKAALSAAIGMSLFDLLSPYSIWAPYTFIIKGTMGLIAAVIAYRSYYKGENIINNIFAFIVAGIWMIVAYYFAGVFIQHFYTNVPLNQAFIIEISHVPGDVAQVVVGILIATPIAELLKRANIKRIIK